MNIKAQATTQWNYFQAHKGKAIGSGVGLTAGILYGLSSAKGKWGVVGLAIGGGLLGAFVGQMVDSNGAMKQVSEGDSNTSQFRGYKRKPMRVNRPKPITNRRRKW